MKIPELCESISQTFIVTALMSPDEIFIGLLSTQFPVVANLAGLREGKQTRMISQSSAPECRALHLGSLEFTVQRSHALFLTPF